MHWAPCTAQHCTDAARPAAAAAAGQHHKMSFNYEEVSKAAAAIVVVISTSRCAELQEYLWRSKLGARSNGGHCWHDQSAVSVLSQCEPPSPLLSVCTVDDDDAALREMHVSCVFALGRMPLHFEAQEQPWPSGPPQRPTVIAVGFQFVEFVLQRAHTHGQSAAQSVGSRTWLMAAIVFGLFHCLRSWSPRPPPPPPLLPATLKFNTKHRAGNDRYVLLSNE